MDESEDYMWMDPPSTKKNNSKDDKKRRFSDEQVKSMELMFETHTKLEPRKKLQLAKELGLHPRQVAIWFQNKRARWKSKQLEREYNALRADYDALFSKFEALKNEKQLLAKQWQKLAELVDKPMDEREKERPYLLLKEKTIEENQYPKVGEKEKDFFSEPTLGSSSVSWPSDQACGASQWWEVWPLSE